MLQPLPYAAPAQRRRLPWGWIIAALTVAASFLPLVLNVGTHRVIRRVDNSVRVEIPDSSG